MLLDEFIDRLTDGAMTAIVVMMRFTHRSILHPARAWRRHANNGDRKHRSHLWRLIR